MSVLCYSCGRNLGELYYLYEILSNICKLESEELFAASAHRALIQSDKIDTLAEIFKTLELDNKCCRTQLATSISIHEVNVLYADLGE